MAEQSLAPIKPNQIEVIQRQLLDTVKAEDFVAMAYKGVKGEKLVALIVQQAKTDGRFMECFASPAGRMSVGAGLRRAASLGLDIDGRQAALVAFRAKSGETLATFMVMFQGRLALIARGGLYTRFSARTVYANDQFEIEYGTNERIVHRPTMGERGEAIGYYAIAHSKDGQSKHFDFMSVPDVQRIRQRSRAKDNGPWVTDFDEMGKKTVVHRMSKTLPCDPETSEFLREADRHERESERETYELELAEKALAEANKPVVLKSRPTTRDEFMAHETQAEPEPDITPDPIALDNSALDRQIADEEAAREKREAEEFFGGESKSQAKRKAAQRGDEH